MLRVRARGVMKDIEIHLEGETMEARYQDEIGRRGLSPEDLEAALEQSARAGFKVTPTGWFAADIEVVWGKQGCTRRPV